MGDLTSVVFTSGSGAAESAKVAAAAAVGAICDTGAAGIDDPVLKTISWVCGPPMDRRMRTRFSPRCTSSSATPVSADSSINSLISWIVILSDYQILCRGRQHFAAGFRDQHGILDANPAETLDIYAGFDGDHHSGF